MLRRRTFVAGLCTLPVVARAAEKSPAILRSARTPSTPVGPDAERIAGTDTNLNRLSVPVRVNGQGPFDFLVDTAAGRSVLSQELAQRLRLQPSGDALLHGIGGVETVAMVRVDDLGIGTLHSSDLEPLVLPWRRLEADGILGLDALRDRCVVLDFNGHSLTVTPSRWQRLGVNPARGEATMKGLTQLGRLTFVDCRVDGQRVHAFIDSGAQWSVGNEALAAAIHAFRPSLGERGAPVTLFGATGQNAVARQGHAELFELGPVQFRSMDLLFSDLHIFDVWGLRERPALLVGGDLLRLFHTVELDFGSNQLRVRRADRTQSPAEQLS